MGRVLRDQLVIEQFIDHSEKVLKEVRKHLLPNAGVIVFVDSTRDGDSHSKRVEKLLRKLGRNVIVATEEAGDTEGQVQRFVEGEGDYLIVKNSAGAGLDCARLKICVDLSTVRQHASCEQRWNRVGTPLEGKLGPITVATLITLRDIFSAEIFRDIYERQGGESTETIDKLIETAYEEHTPGPTPPPVKPIFVEDIAGHDYEDIGGEEAMGKDIDRAKALLGKMSGLSGFNQGNITVPEGARFVKSFNISDGALGLDDFKAPDENFVETGTAVGNHRSKNSTKAKRYARMAYGKVDGDSMKYAWRSIYDKANALIYASPGDHHYINSERYTTTNDIKVLEVVAMAIDGLCAEHHRRQGVTA